MPYKNKIYSLNNSQKANCLFDQINHVLNSIQEKLGATHDLFNPIDENVQYILVLNNKAKTLIEQSLLDLKNDQDSTVPDSLIKMKTEYKLNVAEEYLDSVDEYIVYNTTMMDLVIDKINTCESRVEEVKRFYRNLKDKKCKDHNIIKRRDNIISWVDRLELDLVLFKNDIKSLEHNQQTGLNGKERELINLEHAYKKVEDSPTELLEVGEEILSAVSLNGDTLDYRIEVLQNKLHVLEHDHAYGDLIYFELIDYKDLLKNTETLLDESRDLLQDADRILTELVVKLKGKNNNHQDKLADLTDIFNDNQAAWVSYNKKYNRAYNQYSKNILDYDDDYADDEEHRCNMYKESITLLDMKPAMKYIDQTYTKLTSAIRKIQHIVDELKPQLKEYGPNQKLTNKYNEIYEEVCQLEKLDNELNQYRIELSTAFLKKYSPEETDYQTVLKWFRELEGVTLKVSDAIYILSCETKTTLKLLRK